MIAAVDKIRDGICPVDWDSECASVFFELFDINQSKL